MNKICYRSYDCPKCSLNQQIPFVVQGLYQIYSGRVRCITRGCGDISKRFFKHLINEKVQWKWGKVPDPQKEKPVKPPKPPKDKKAFRQKKVYKSPEKKKPASAWDQCNLREKKAIKGYLEGKSKKDALLSAGYSKSTAETKQSLIFGKVRIQKTIQELMEKSNLTDKRILDTLSDGLDANKVISALVIAPDGSGMKDAGSLTRDFVEVPDHDLRHKVAVTCLKLKGHLGDNSGNPVAGPVETYEQWRQRVGLNDYSPEECLRRLQERRKMRQEGRHENE
jgi:hypothetical protein